jgi:hypothetical protein
MSEWLNNKNRVYKAGEIERPCHKCGFCPYGQLVEEFPCNTEAAAYARKHKKFVKFVETNKGTPQGAWTPCSEDEEGAVPDINWASGMVKEEYSCEVFGHDCPVYYHAEMISE